MIYDIKQIKKGSLLLKSPNLKTRNFKYIYFIRVILVLSEKPGVVNLTKYSPLADMRPLSSLPFHTTLSEYSLCSDKRNLSP